MGQRLEDIRRLRERLTTGTLTGSAAQQERARLKNRILGVLLRDARQASGRSEADAAALLGIATEDYRAFESGAASPTLPQLEVLAYAYNVPMSHFWGSQTLADKRQEHSVREKIPAIIALRDRIVGIQIRQARERENLTVAQIAEETGIDARRLRDAERGNSALGDRTGDSLPGAAPAHQRYGGRAWPGGQLAPGTGRLRALRGPARRSACVHTRAD